MKKSIMMLVSKKHRLIPVEEPIEVEVPVYNDKKEVIKMKLPMLRPTGILEYLFSTKLTIPESAVTTFWEHLESVGDTWAKACNGLADRLMPVGLYGDEAHYGADFGSPTDKISCIFLDLPLWRPRSVRLSRFLVFSIGSHRMIGRETLHPIWRAIVEDLNNAYLRGVAGRRFIVAQLRGDQAWNRFVWQYKRWWIANDVCFQCKARQKGNFLYYEIGDQASWKGTEFSTVEFISSGLPQENL